MHLIIHLYRNNSIIIGSLLGLYLYIFKHNTKIRFFLLYLSPEERHKMVETLKRMQEDDDGYLDSDDDGM